MWNIDRHFSIRQVALVILWILISRVSPVVAQGLETISIEANATIWDVIPKKTIACIACDNLKECSEQFKRSTAFNQFNSEKWTSFVESQRKLFIGSLLNPDPWLAFRWDEVTDLACPSALIASSLDNSTVGPMLLLRIDEEATRKNFIKKWIENRGGEKSFEQKPFGESNSVWLPKITQQMRRSPSMAIVGNWIAVSNTSKLLENWIRTLREKRSLAESTNPPFLDAFPKFKEPWEKGEWRWMVRPWDLLKGLLAEQNVNNSTKSGKRNSANSTQVSIKDWIEFGFDGMLLAGGNIYTALPEQNFWIIDYKLLISPPLRGGLKLMNFEAGPPIDLPHLFSSSVDSWTSSYVDIKPWFDGVSYFMNRTIDPETPGVFEDVLDAILTDPEGPKIDVRKDLIYRSGPLIIDVDSTETNSNVESKLSRDHAWAVAIGNHQETEDVLKRFFQIDDVVRSQKLGEFQWWYTENNEPLLFAAEKSDSKTITIMALDQSYLYAATNTKWLVDLIKQTTDSKAPTPPLNRKYDCWNDQLYMANSGTASSLQGIELRSWLHTSWNMLPVPLSNYSSTSDIAAVIITELLLGSDRTQEVLSNAAIPDWQSVRPSLGLVSHKLSFLDKQLEGRVWLNSHPTK